MSDKVAIILLNWNNYKDTAECLLSLSHLDDQNFSVFLVDNHSNDHSFEQIKADYDHNKYGNIEFFFIQSRKNLGFAGGNNIAVQKAYDLGYPYFWLLNNDTVVLRNSLTYLLKEIKMHPEVGIAGSKIYYYGTNKIWFAGGEINTYTGKTKHRGIGEMDHGQYDEKRMVDYITGCSLFFRRDVVDTIGFMKERYFLYYEEAEWNLRAGNYGWKILYVPQSQIYHKVSASSGGENNQAPYVAFYEIRNAYWMIKDTQRSKIKRTLSFHHKYCKALRKLIQIYLFNQDNKSVRIKYIIKGLLYR
ncbi:glycosyltransferase family 2 protein [Sporolactobacillus sp. Y61]|uniref:Glycosyltransferase family 2 protein n=1 Tax=Sporolactobacillus sp. Y61 TaxID=3160863 RepID=A0AAU8IIV0_9BACL